MPHKILYTLAQGTSLAINYGNIPNPAIVLKNKETKLKYNKLNVKNIAKNTDKIQN